MTSSPSGVSRQDAPKPNSHELKVWPEYFEALLDGSKTFEYRIDDREPRFAVGDYLRLCENAPGFAPTGRKVWREVTYIARGTFIPKGYCVMAIKPRTSPASPSSETATEAFDTAALRRRATELDGIDWPGGANGVALIEDAADEIDRLCASLTSSSPVPAEAPSEDTKRLDWLEANAYQLSTYSEGETCDAEWDVYPNQLALDEDTELPHGRTVRQAIDAARSTPTEATND